MWFKRTRTAEGAATPPASHEAVKQVAPRKIVDPPSFTIPPGVATLGQDPARRAAAQARFDSRKAARTIKEPVEEIVLAPPKFDFDVGELLADNLQWPLEVLYESADGNRTRRPFTVLRLYGNPPDVCNYVWGYCHLRHASRTLAVRRIKEIIDNETGEAVPDEDVELWLPKRAGIRLNEILVPPNKPTDED